MAHDEQDHIRYTNEQIAKNLIALEEHFKNYPCGECMGKHCLAIEEYAEEGMGMVADPSMYREIKVWAESTRKNLEQKSFWNESNFQKLLRQARDLRRKIQGGAHPMKEPQQPPDLLEQAVGSMADAFELLKDAYRNLLKLGEDAHAANINRAAQYLTDAIELTSKTSERVDVYVDLREETVHPDGPSQ
jgi:hypothetical protein